MPLAITRATDKSAEGNEEVLSEQSKGLASVAKCPQAAIAALLGALAIAVRKMGSPTLTTQNLVAFSIKHY